MTVAERWEMALILTSVLQDIVLLGYFRPVLLSSLSSENTLKIVHSNFIIWHDYLKKLNLQQKFRTEELCSTFLFLYF